MTPRSLKPELWRWLEISPFTWYMAQDWMFPVEVGKMTHQILEAHNHHMIYREIDGLGHAFARSELTRLLPWFSDALNLES